MVDYQFLRLGGKYINSMATFLFDNRGRFFLSARSQEVFIYPFLWVKVQSVPRFLRNVQGLVQDINVISDFPIPIFRYFMNFT